MKKVFTFLISLMLAIVLVAPAQAEFQDFWAQVYSREGYSQDIEDLTEITSGVTFKVLQRNSDTAETLYEYGDDTYTSLTNPVTTTNYALGTVMKAAGVLSFRVDPAETNDTYVDLIVVDTAGGYTRFYEDFDKYTHKIVIDERPNIQHHGCIWFTGVSGTETDTGIDFDYDTMVEHVQVEVVTVDAGMTLNVGLLSTGTNGDADGFLAATSVATAGFPLVTLATSGALMDDATNFDPDGHAVISANEQSLTHTGSDSTDTSAGYIHYWFTRMR